jgi:transcriptional regulator with XRE-family HTH domain
MDEYRVEDLLTSVPRALRLLRESRGLGQDDLEELSEKRGEKVQRTSIARYESGSRTPSLDSLRKLLGALDVSWEELGRALAAARRADGKNFVGMSEAPRLSCSKDGPSMKLTVELGEASPESVADVLRKVMDKEAPAAVRPESDRDKDRKHLAT